MKTFSFKTDPVHAHQDVVREIGAKLQDWGSAERDRLRFDILRRMRSMVAEGHITDNQKVSVEVGPTWFQIK